MPENPIPSTKSEPEDVPVEFNFAKPPSDSPRMRRRSLKAKSAGLTKPSGGPPPAARELEREAPPLSVEEAVKPAPQAVSGNQTAQIPAAHTSETPVAPPRTTPAQTATTTTQPASTSAPKITPSASAPPSGVNSFKPAVTTGSTGVTNTSPHGTRPATLYYSSNARKAETPSPMKTIPTASPAASSSASSATTTLPTSAARPTTSTSFSRPGSTVDYRANVERQSREQKSVGDLLSYVVYGLIGFFVLGAGLAGYGSYVIFQRLHDQSQTVSELDSRYAAANKDLNAKLASLGSSLATTQDTLGQAQAQITRQQDLIVKQQEELNRLISETSDNASAVRQEKQARTQDTASLRERIRDLEYRNGSTQKY